MREDPAAVPYREPVEDLGRTLDRVRQVEQHAAQVRVPLQDGAEDTALRTAHVHDAGRRGEVVPVGNARAPGHRLHRHATEQGVTRAGGAVEVVERGRAGRCGEGRLSGPHQPQ